MSTVADAVVVPTCVAGSHPAPVKLASEHVGTACGLPTSPGGSVIVRLRTSSLDGVGTKDMAMVRSGCDADCGADGVTDRLETSTRACAGAAAIADSARAQARAAPRMLFGPRPAGRFPLLVRMQDLRARCAQENKAARPAMRR